MGGCDRLELGASRGEGGKIEAISLDDVTLLAPAVAAAIRTVTHLN